MVLKYILNYADVTVVDEALVSHSNPVRQSLYGLGDVGQPKATAFAAALAALAPGTRTTPVTASVPMPGHVHDPGNCASDLVPE